MEPLTPEDKLKQAFNDKLHASVINDEECRNAFLKVTLESQETNEELLAMHRFITAVDYCLGALGYAICDMEHKDGPVHIDDPRFLEEQDS